MERQGLEQRMGRRAVQTSRMEGAVGAFARRTAMEAAPRSFSEMRAGLPPLAPNRHKVEFAPAETRQAVNSPTERSLSFSSYLSMATAKLNPFGAAPEMEVQEKRRNSWSDLLPGKSALDNLFQSELVSALLGRQDGEERGEEARSAVRPLLDDAVHLDDEVHSSNGTVEEHKVNSDHDTSSEASDDDFFAGVTLDDDMNLSDISSSAAAVLSQNISRVASNASGFISCTDDNNSASGANRFEQDEETDGEVGADAGLRRSLLLRPPRSEDEDDMIDHLLQAAILKVETQLARFLPSDEPDSEPSSRQSVSEDSDGEEEEEEEEEEHNEGSRLLLPVSAPVPPPAKHDSCKRPCLNDAAAKKAAILADTAYVDSDGEDEDTCFICLLALDSCEPGCEPAEKIRLPCANHCNESFVHAKCIFEWKERRNATKSASGTCPLCRAPLGAFTFSPPDILKTKNFRMFSVRNSFCVHPISKDAGMVRCFVRVTPSSWIGQSQYEMYVQAPCALPYPLGVLPGQDSPKEGDQLIMRARKRPGLLTSRLEVTLDRDGEDYNPQSPNYLGYVQSNFSGLEHTLTTFQPETGVMELVSVGYHQNRFGMGVGPRRMRVALPKVQEVGLDAASSGSPGEPQIGFPPVTHVTAPHRPRGRTDTLSAAIAGTPEQALSESQDLLFCQNREPSWVEAIQAYSLDFHGRVTLPSNKNFQLVMQNQGELKDKTVLQFGKVISHEFHSVAVYTLDFQWPISPLQAFGIALSSCTSKAMCA